MDKTIKILAKICEEHRFQEKLLFVPSYYIGHQIGEYLAKTGTSWINLRITTVAGYAQKLLALHLNQDKIHLIDCHERLAIIEMLYRSDCFSTGKGSYFKGVIEKPGILKCLSNAVHEMRMAGLNHRSVDPGAFVIPEKGEELVRLLDAYDRFLKENRLIDHAGLLSLAIDRLKKENYEEKDKVIMVLSDFSLTCLEKDFIRLVGNKNLVVIGHTRPEGLDLPGSFFMPVNPSEDQAIDPEKDIDLLPWLFQPETAPGPFHDGSVSIFHALGESNEVREVFRRILKEGSSLDDVEIIVTKLDPYIPLIYEIATSLGIPATFACGIPVTYTRPGKALVLYLKWQEEFRVSDLRRLFSGGYLDLDSLEIEGERVSSGRAATILRDANIGWGRDRYLSGLKSLKEGYLCKAKEKREEGEEESAKRAELKARNVDWVGRFIEEIMATIPSTTPGETVNTRELYTGTIDFLKKFARTAGELDISAKSRLIDILESLMPAPSFSAPAKEVTARLTEVIKGVSVGHSNPKPGCIHIAHYRAGGYSGRFHTFVLGLDQKKFPRMLLQDPVLLDGERQQLGCGMALSGELLHEDLYTMVRVLGSVRGKVTLSYSCRDLRGDRESFPSSILLGAYRLITPDHDGDYRALTRFLGEPAGFIPRPEVIPLNSWEWWLSQKSVQYGSSSVLRCYPHLLEGERAESKRDTEELGEYDGWVPSSTGALDPLVPEVVLSCSKLEALAKCPYAFFLQHVLGIEPLEEMEKDLRQWLDPRQRGELLHKVFYLLMKELKAKGELPNLEVHMGLLESIAMQEIEHWKNQVPLASELAFNRDLLEIKLALQTFLRDEEEHCKSVNPYLFELSFGIKGDRRSEIFSEEPLEISLKEKRSFKLRGRIDRVDQCGANEYEVWDYKTGGTWGYKEESYLNRGRHLQHAPMPWLPRSY